MNIKQILDQTQIVKQIPWIQLIGDSILEKSNSMLIELLKMSHELGGHDNCIIASHRDNMHVTAMHALVKGKNEFSPDELLDEPYSLEIKLGGFLYYHNDTIELDKFLIARASSWKNGKPTSFKSQILEIPGLKELYEDLK